MSTKPTVFLSHSKADKDFIERIASDLRHARINVWYDEWEIPAGDSFRRRIFVDGISGCDLFFVYLSPASVSSYWVSKELDAAFMSEVSSKGLFLATFVSDEAVRKNLSLDLQSLHSPVFDDNNYSRPLNHLISRVWEVTCEKRVKAAADAQRTAMLELENQVLRLERADHIDIGKIDAELSRLTYRINEETVSLKQVFIAASRDLAAACSSYGLDQHLAREFHVTEEGLTNRFYFATGISVSDFLGQLIILGLVRYIPPNPGDSAYYVLTEAGVTYIRGLPGSE